ncbi:hypothetical protein H6G65_19195 [Microcystis elabens FACHB-917]|nr:hypothetical protein [Microcystis elabens FACHB-917]
MSLALLALLISGLSVAVASLSLGWNIYRDVIARPRVNMRMGVRQIVEDGESVNGYVVWVRCVNLGPGKVTLEVLVVRSGFLKRLKDTQGQFGFIKFVASAIPGGSSLPLTLDPGEYADLLIPLNYDTFLGSTYTMLGIRDFHGRIHWAPSKDIRDARQQWKDLMSCEAIT